jgi:Fructose-bisphosphate aldolase class-II
MAIALTPELESVENSALYTQPEDILNIHNRLSKISPYFSIAAGFGNVHGVYSPGNVRTTLKTWEAHFQHLLTETGETAPRASKQAPGARGKGDWLLRKEARLSGVPRRQRQYPRGGSRSFPDGNMQLTPASSRKRSRTASSRSTSTRTRR